MHLKSLPNSTTVYSYIDTAPVGLKDDDHLIEIDGKNVENLGDDQIKKYLSSKHSQSLQLLVVNTATYNYYKRKNKRIHSGLPGVQIMPQSMSNQFPSCMGCLFQFSFYLCLLKEELNNSFCRLYQQNQSERFYETHN